MSKIKSASFTRYTKVHKVLLNDPLLQKQLSKTMIAVCRPDNSTQDFPQEVVYVVDQIQSKNLDVSTCTQKDIMKLAYDLLVLHPQPIPAYTSAPEAEPAPPAPKAVRKAKPTVVKVAKPKAAKKVATPKEAPKEAPKEVVRKARQAPKAKAPEAPAADVKNEPKAVNKPMVYVRPNVPFAVGCAALANLQAVVTLLEPFVDGGDAEAKVVSEKLNDLIDDIHRRTIIPSAKEITESTAG